MTGRLYWCSCQQPLLRTHSEAVGRVVEVNVRADAQDLTGRRQRRPGQGAEDAMPKKSPGRYPPEDRARCRPSGRMRCRGWSTGRQARWSRHSRSGRGGFTVVEERQVREMLDRLASLHRRAATTREVRDLEPVGNGGARHGLAMMASIISPVGRSTEGKGWPDRRSREPKSPVAFKPTTGGQSFQRLEWSGLGPSPSKRREVRLARA
jgi:hypothetical protein